MGFMNKDKNEIRALSRSEVMEILRFSNRPAIIRTIGWPKIINDSRCTLDIYLDFLDLGLARMMTWSADSKMAPSCSFKTHPRDAELTLFIDCSGSIRSILTYTTIPELEESTKVSAATNR